MIQNNFVTIQMYPDKETKNTIRFAEYEEEEMYIGHLYVQKFILEELGYIDGNDITVEITIN